MNTPKVIDAIVDNDLCIGCGVCTYACPSSALKMQWNDYGFLVPVQQNSCDSDGACLQVCPFNPFANKEVETENEIANLFLKDSSFKHPKIGHYNNIYTGFSKAYRLTSSSGGIATYIFTQLLKQGIANHIISVKQSDNADFEYEYAVNSYEEEVKNASKTKYYPVSLEGVLKKIDELEGKVAIVGVGCFIKAIRLLQYQQPAFKEKIVFLVGIICGGVKSRFFTEYLAEKAGVKHNELEKPLFRVKDLQSTASDYSFKCTQKGTNKEYAIKMQNVGDMWGTGLFKANACDFCDDVTTELADISLGDAWINPFAKDGRGTNVVVTRSALADAIINHGIKSEELEMKALSLERFLDSQKGSFNHRHTGLKIRIHQAKRNNKPIPVKRYDNESVSIDFKLVQMLRMKVRRKSLELWKETKNAQIFDEKMKKYLRKLQIATRLYHYKKSIVRRIGNLFSK